MIYTFDKSEPQRINSLQSSTLPHGSSNSSTTTSVRLTSLANPSSGIIANTAKVSSTFYSFLDPSPVSTSSSSLHPTKYALLGPAYLCKTRLFPEKRVSRIPVNLILV